MGEAKDGRRLGVCLVFCVGIGMRLGVFDVVIGTDAVGENLRRFEGESAIDQEMLGMLHYLRNHTVRPWV